MQQPAQERAAQHHTPGDQVFTPARILGVHSTQLLMSLLPIRYTVNEHLVGM